MIPLLLLPGMLCDEALWEAQVAALSDVASPSVPDMAGTTVDEMAAKILGDAPPRFALAGLSMGGYVALAIAAAAPERVTSLALFNTSARADTAEQRAGRDKAIALAESGAFERIVANLLTLSIDPSRADDHALRAPIEAMLRRAGSERFVAEQRICRARPDRRELLRRLHLPVHAIGGINDRIIPPDHAGEIASLSGGTFTLIDDCGHLSPLEHPALVIEILRDMLDGKPANVDN